MIVLSPHDPRPLRGAPVAVIDFETTGPDPRTCRPVQVAVATCRLGDEEPTVALSLLIHPGEPIPAEASAVHGIHDADVADAPTWPEALPAVLDAIGGHVLAAFNLPFDWQVLSRGIIEAGLDPALVPFGALDPLVWAKVVMRYQKGKKLVDVAGRYDVPIQAHDAAGDALATALIMPRLLHDLGRHREGGAAPLRSVAAIWDWTCKAGVAEDQGFADWCARQGRPAPDLVWGRLAGQSG